MTHKSEIRAAGYEWVHLNEDRALLRAADGRVEEWRKARDGDSSDTGRMLRSARLVFVYVRDVTFEPLPEWGRADLKPGQTVELEATSVWWSRHQGYGVIQSVYSIFGAPRYRVLLGVNVASFKPSQVRPFPPSA